MVTLAEFRHLCPVLVHYAPQGHLRPERGLLTAAQILDQSADATGHVWAKFYNDAKYQSYEPDHWKTHSRFRRGAGEAGSNLLVRDAVEPTRVHVLGNNYPLGEGTCLGKTIQLTDNRPGDPEPTRQDWFRTLNDMFWVFDAANVNHGVVNHLRAASPTGKLSRLALRTASLPDEVIAERVRLSAINGGGSNGACARGTATYKAPSEWTRAWPPREIGIRGGIPPALYGTLEVELDEV
jgi:hypothetical protein